LRQQSCDLAQGYFIARPMPPEDIGAWQTDWQVRHDALQAA
jgi:EAL domain-containing protein (putative c-di-GMP-specific phosphodiesterase class I)